MNLSNFVKKMYQLGIQNSLPREDKKYSRETIQNLFWITIDRTRFTNTYFVAFHPSKKTVAQAWLGLCSRQKKKKLKLSELNFRRTLRLFVKMLRKKLKGERKWPTAVRFEGPFTQFQIRETLDSLRRLKSVHIVLVRNVTALHLFSGIRFKKQRRI